MHKGCWKVDDEEKGRVYIFCLLHLNFFPINVLSNEFILYRQQIVYNYFYYVLQRFNIIYISK